ncbi:MAG: type IV pilus secretin PilQ [Thermodesulfobacteriota bacterium]|nr:type IV pilus secretin PilQ [Thermodesulfobacteriota bacterium]
MNGNIKRWSTIGAIIFFLGMLMTVLAGCASNTMAVKETKKDAGQSVEPKHITEISASEDLTSSIIWIRGNRLLTYTSVKQPLPLGVLLYFPETALGDINTSYVPDSDIVSSIKASELTTKGHTSRVEILLKKDASYEVTKEDTGLKISFNKESGVPVSIDTQLEIKEKSSDKSQNAKEPPAASEQEKLDAKTTANKTVTPQIKKDKPAWINRIDFSAEEGGKSTIIIGTTIPIKYDLKKIDDKKLLLNLYNTRLPEYRQRPLVTTRFQSAVDRITPVQTPAMKDTSLVTIELREPAPYFVEQTDSLLLLHFEASSISPRPFDKAKLPLWKKVMTQPAADTGAKQDKAGDPHGPESTRPVAQETALGAAYDIDRQKTTDTITGIRRSLDFYRTETKKKYVGEKIAVDFFRTNIKNVFRIIREVSRENFAIDKDVTGEVTMSLEKPIPWDQVLTLVLKMNKLGLVYEEGIIRVATLKTLAKEEEERKAKLAAKREAENEEELITVFMRISYIDAINIGKHLVVDGKFVNDQGDSKFNPIRGKVSVDKTNNMIVMSDVARSIKRAKEIVQKLDRVTPQVLIEARIVEASNNFSRELGVTLSGTYGPTGNKYIRDFSFTATNPPISSLGSFGINFSKVTGTPWTLGATIEAAESEGQVKIISTPKILALDNTQASIIQGLRYPYTKLDADGNTTVELENIALELIVTPHVTPDERIAMEISVKNNEVGPVINNELSFTTKEANTELLVNDGDTVIIGGIRKTRTDRDESGIPGLMKIPVLGWLFKTKSKEDQLDELLIFITPRIVQLEQRNIRTN